MYEEVKQFTEQDWKLFRKKIIVWQENYMDNLNKEYIAILSRDKNPSDNFWELEKRIRKDKNRIGVTIDMRRSVMIMNILTLLKDGVITMDDLNDFSDLLKETIKIYKDPASFYKR